MICQIFILSSLFFIKQTQTATNVGGVLLQNTVWTATGSPYNLVNDVHVPRNVTLTIQQGARINFKQGDFEILVKGFLRVQGTSIKQVVFEGGSQTNQKSMIKFQSTRLSLSSITYSRFNGPQRGLTIAKAADGLVQNSDTLSVLSSSFLGNTLIQVEGNSSIASLELRSCFLNETIFTNTFIGNRPIRVINSSVFYSTFSPQCTGDCIYIDNCTLRHTVVEYNSVGEGNGFTLYNSNAINTTVTSSSWNWPNILLTVKKSIINDFKIVGNYELFSQQSNITFEDSTIFNFSTVKTYTWSSYAGIASNFAIRRCKFTLGNLVFHGGYYYYNNVLSIKDSILTKVTLTQLSTSYVRYPATFTMYMRNVSFIDGNLTFYSRNVDIAYSNITVTSPLIVGGDSSISCSSIGRSGSVTQRSTIGIIASSLTITNSTIKNFDTGMQVTARSLNKITITKNNFYGNSLYNVENRGAYDVTARGNYWGTNNAGVIVSKIFDYWDNINYGDVLYSNYASKSLPAETGCPRYVEDKVV